jgi:hypothetical protein
MKIICPNCEKIQNAEMCPTQFTFYVADLEE